MGVEEKVGFLIASKHPLVAAVDAISIPVALPRGPNALSARTPELGLAAGTHVADEHYCQGEASLLEAQKSHLVTVGNVFSSTEIG